MAASTASTASLHDLFAQTQRLDWVIRLMDRQPRPTPPSGPNGAWLRYRKKFVTPGNASRTACCSRTNYRNRPATGIARLRRAAGDHRHHRRGNPLGGRVMGKTRIIDALSTLSFSYPRRAGILQRRTGKLILLQARKEGTDPLALRGSLCRRHGLRPVHAVFIQQARWTSMAMGISTWNPRDFHRQRRHHFKHRLGQRRSRGGSASGRAPSLEDGFKTLYPLDVLAFRRITPAGSARRPPQEPACCAWTWAGTTSTGYGRRTLRDHPLQPQHPLRDGRRELGKEVDRVRHRSVVRQD